MMDKNEILKKLSEHKASIQEKYGVEKIGLFGSYAKGKQTPQSDINIYIESKHKTFRNLLDYGSNLKDFITKKLIWFISIKEAKERFLSLFKRN